MSVWETFTQQSKELASTAAGSALDAYAEKLKASNEKPAAPATADTKTVGTTSSKRPLIIGAIVAGVIGLVVWLATRKKKGK